MSSRRRSTTRSSRRPAAASAGRSAGMRATGFSWWTPLRVMLAVATVTFGLGVVQKSPCVVTGLGDTPVALHLLAHVLLRHPVSCTSAAGLAEGVCPYQPLSDLPADRRPADERGANDLTIEYPVLSGVWMGATAFVTHALGKAPDLSDVPHAAMSGRCFGVQHDSAVFWARQRGRLLCGAADRDLAFLVRAQPRRPWDAMLVAASPALALAAMINWDVLALGMRRRRSCGPGRPDDPSPRGSSSASAPRRSSIRCSSSGRCWCCACASGDWRPGSRPRRRPPSPGRWSTCRSTSGLPTPSRGSGASTPRGP